MEATKKQIEYILALQAKLGGSTRYVEPKLVYGKNPIGFRLTKAVAGQIIDILKKRVESLA